MSPPISAEFICSAVHLATEAGVDLSACLRMSGIDERVLLQRDARLTTEQVTAFTQTVWRLTGDELVGLGPHPVPRGTFRVICLTLIHLPDLGSALRRISDVSRVFPGVPRMRIVDSDDRMRLEIHSAPSSLASHLSAESALIAHQLHTDFLLILWHRFSAWLIGRRVGLLSVEMPYPAPDATGRRTRDDIFGRHVSYDAAVAAIEFDNSLLRSPIVQTEETLEDYLRESPTLLFSARDYGSDASSTVRRALEVAATGRNAAGGAGGASDIADMLSISVPHLRRVLRQEGTSLGRLREEVLRDAAIAGLGRGESVDELSARLGFSEPSAFRRAFKRWTGDTPGAYRR